MYPDWTSLTNSGNDDTCETAGDVGEGQTPMMGTWAEISVARYNGAAPTMVEGSTCCSGGVTGDDRDADVPDDYGICESPSVPNTNFNACRDDTGTEDTCCAAPQATVSCADGYSPIREVNDDGSGTECTDNGGDANKVQWHCCSCSAGLAAWKADNPGLWAGDGCNPRDGCTFKPRMEAEISSNVKMLIASVFMLVLGYAVSMRHIKFASYFFALLGVVWSKCTIVASHCCDAAYAIGLSSIR